MLSALALNSIGCGAATRLAAGTVGAAGRVAGSAVATTASLVPLAASLVPTKLIFGCIPEGTLIDTPDGPRPIESISPGETVIGFEGDPVQVLQQHSYLEDSNAERFLRIEFENGSWVQLSDRHRLNGIRAQHLKPGDRVSDEYVKSIEIFGGVERSHDLLTEDAGYQISGLPVNSMIEEMIAASRDGLDSVGSE